jgi:hypothetical protein
MGEEMLWAACGYGCLVWDGMGELQTGFADFAMNIDLSDWMLSERVIEGRGAFCVTSQSKSMTYDQERLSQVR